MQRDRLIDGYRGVAVLCVVASHALGYHFGTPPPIPRLAQPLAEIGVQIFFVISGYIITTLLLKEEARGGISIPAFYARRAFRILPPLFAYFIGLLLLRRLGVITFNPSTIANSALFTCNTGLTDCEWWVAHTWSLAVEEQFYLAWPLLLTILPRRTGFLVGLIAVLLTAYLLLPAHDHSNWLAFACIAAGALYACNDDVKAWIAKHASYWAWLVAAAAVFLPPLEAPRLQVLTPLAVPYILFASRELPLIRRVLESTPLNAVGLCSYSLYLWQQLFLTWTDVYPLGPPPIMLLPVVVAASYFLIEKPCARIGHRVSNWIKARPLHPAQADLDLR
ncbi:hypothetical protein GCM10023264_17870 [Sphingomonas daechungensis]|uniref:Acyltransferase n=1 Tax=Sphingomonas daechungensis TaxID=1176646 RepID=A0ABX6T2H0_9SPHN|nr:acyltransferase [Sphingomonas daechungensis]QNP44027.1 acyltransferase [Sphingomonas daechungensis]